MNRTAHFPRPAITAGLSALTALALGLGSQLAAVPAFAADEALPAPEIVAVGTDQVTLQWSDLAATQPDTSEQDVRVYDATGDRPIATHRLDDPADPDLVRGDADAPGELAADVLGLAAGTEYRFEIAALSATGEELAVTTRTDVVHTTAEPADADAAAPPADSTAEPDPIADPQPTPDALATTEPTAEPAPGASAPPAEPIASPSSETDAAPAAPAASAEPTSESTSDGADDSESDAAAVVQPEQFRALLGATSPLAAEIPSATAPTATVKGATAVLVDWTAYAATTTPVLPGYDFYTVTVYAGDTDTIVKTASGAMGSRNVLVTGLSPATIYSFDVKEGSTAATAGRSSTVTTNATAIVPGVISAAPTATAQSSTEMLVSWPALEGTDVYRYTVKAYYAADGTTAATKTGIDPFTAGTTIQFTGLRPYTAYAFTVTVQGYDMNGAESTASSPVTTDRGVALAPQTPVIAKATTSDTGVRLNWTAPASDGGYPVTGYRIELYNTASTSTFNLVAEDFLPGDATSYVLDDVMIVGSAMSFRVAAVNAAGTGPFTGLASSLTIAATASPSTAVSGTAANLMIAAGMDPGSMVVSWKVPAGATPNTGYIARVVEHLPSNAPTNSTNYTYRVVDLGLGTSTVANAAQTATITGLDGGRSYRVAITAYELQPDGSKLYRTSSARNTVDLALSGSTVPSKPSSAAPAPVATGVDGVSWTGSALTATYSGGSPVTAYAIYLYENGSAGAVQRVVVATDADEAPSTTFTGLARDTLYQVRYAGINANGEGALSDISAGGRTLARPVPGSVPPAYADLDALLAAIANREVATITAQAAGISGPFEANLPMAVHAPWTGEAGEAWLYGEDGGPLFLDEYTVADGSAGLDTTLGDLAAGDYRLLLVPSSGTAAAIPVTIVRAVVGRTDLDDALFRWGLDNEASHGAYFGGCNYLAAGKVPDVGSSQLLTAARYSAEAGNVRIEKPDASGAYGLATWDGKCRNRNGQPVTTAPGSYTESQVVIDGGTGWVDPSTNSADIQWSGDFTVVFYGGLTYWYASDPHLVVENGVGTLTATASGFGADMNDSSKWVVLAPRQITLASLSGVRMTTKGLTVTPDYLGVAVTTSGSATAQTSKTADNAAYWGSFPQDFVDFQQETGQSSYWYTSGGGQDSSKPALPLSIVYEASADDANAGAGSGDAGGTLAPAAVEPPRPSPTRGAPFASTTETSVEDLDALQALIDSGAITLVDAATAGIPASFPIGQRLDLRFTWPGDDEGGVIWLYPGTQYIGSFRVGAGTASAGMAVPLRMTGDVRLSIDTSAIAQEGPVYLVFFGDQGTVVAVQATATAPLPVSEEVSQTAGGAQTGGDGGGAEAISAPAPIDPLLLGLAIGGGVLALAAAGAATALFARSRSRRAV